VRSLLALRKSVLPTPLPSVLVSFCRDIKPDNFLLASEESGALFLIDFGLSKRFRCVSSELHVPLCAAYIC
jgi:hypothetical protein